MKKTISKKKTATKKPAAKPEKSDTVLVLRTCAGDGTSHNGFKWPSSGPVEATDWKPTNECGNGLHGWLWGHGDWALKNTAPDARWLVVEVEASTIIDLVGKVKFPRGNVIATFEHWRDAMQFIRVCRPIDPNVDNVATGYYGHASATGDSGHASATGTSGHASAMGNYGHASATGDSGHASATGDSGHASATGDSGNASATGNYGNASATGNYGNASAMGKYGHASATGNYGWSAAGYDGKARAAANGVLTCLWWDDKAKRPRVTVGYVGENGIKPDTWYAANEKGELEVVGK